MPIDIREDHLHLVQQILKEHVPYHSVVAFGSRVQGNATSTSDLDLCLKGERLSFQALSHLKDAFSLSTLPYFVDIVEWIDLSPSFQSIVQECNILIYKTK